MATVIWYFWCLLNCGGKKGGQGLAWDAGDWVRRWGQGWLGSGGGTEVAPPPTSCTVHNWNWSPT